MKKTIIYLATLATLSAGGVAAVNTVNDTFLSPTVAHAGTGAWILLKPLDSQTAQYVQSDPIEGAVLTDAGQQVYNNVSSIKQQFLFTTAPYIRDENQVNLTGPNSGGWVGQMDTMTFNAKDSSMQPLNVVTISTLGEEDVADGTNNLPDYISQIEEYNSTHSPNADADVQVMQTALALESAGIIPKDSKIKTTLDKINNRTDNPSSDTASTISSSDQSSGSTSTSSTGQTSSNGNKVTTAKQKVKTAQKALKKASQDVKDSKHKSKKAKQNAKKKYDHAKAALKKAKATLKKAEK